eukprot:4275199-Pyramimonas_sp.AAC.2
MYFGEEGVLGLAPAKKYTSIGASVVASVPAEIMCRFEDLLRSLKNEMQVNSPTEQELPASKKTILCLDSLRDVRKLKKVGVGGYGMVYLVRLEGRVWAMKAIMKDHILQSQMATQVSAPRKNRSE